MNYPKGYIHLKSRTKKKTPKKQFNMCSIKDLKVYKEKRQKETFEKIMVKYFKYNIKHKSID